MTAYRVTHTTRYEYGEPVTLCHSEAHLKPRGTEVQRVASSVVRVDPAPVLVSERDDFFGNRVTAFCIQQPHTVLTVTAVSTVELGDARLPLLQDTAPPWDQVVRRLADGGDEETLEARQYRLPSPQVPVDAACRDYAAPSFPPGRPVLDAARDLMGRIHAEFVFDPESTTVATPVAEVLAARRGVCQDFAHLGLACLRSLGLAARYVSGYLETLPPPGQPRLTGADASHAWLAVYVPDLGWTDFDPTNDLIPAGRHVTVAWGRDYDDVTPLKGVVLGGGPHALQVSVDVMPLEWDG